MTNVSVLNERLDSLRALIQSEGFLTGDGLSNEVNIRVFCYDPADEMTVQHFIGMTGKLALPSLIALCSIALARPTLGSLAVLGEISISGTIIKVDELANTLQCCLDSGAKKVLIPSVSMIDFATVPADLMGAFQLIPYSSAEDAVFKALGVE